MVNEQKELQKKGEILPFHVTDEGIVQELTNLMFAGTDTTGTTLTYLFWELARHPEWILRLREEVNEALQGQDTFSYHEISELPVLDAVIQEILRVRPAGPGGLPRLTPEEGAVVDGVALPGRVCQTWSSVSSGSMEIGQPIINVFST
jgi:cytochrome P450